MLQNCEVAGLIQTLDKTNVDKTEYFWAVYLHHFFGLLVQPQVLTHCNSLPPRRSVCLGDGDATPSIAHLRWPQGMGRCRLSDKEETRSEWPPPQPYWSMDDRRALGPRSSSGREQIESLPLPLINTKVRAGCGGNSRTTCC